MNPEDTLGAAFADEADRRPDADDVLDAVHRRIAGRRRLVVTRTAGALAAAAVVTTVAVGASVLNSPSSHRSEQAAAGRPSQSAPADASPSSPPSSPPSSAPSSAPSNPPSTSAPRTGTSAPPPPSPSGGPSSAVLGGTYDYSTIDAGYLPGPATQNPAGTSNSPGFEERDWDVTVDGVNMDVIIWTETGTLPTRMQATGGGGYRSVIVGGHPGRKFVGNNVTIVAFDRGNGTIAYAGPSVQHLTASVTTARIASIAMKVAENIRFDRHDPIPGR